MRPSIAQDEGQLGFHWRASSGEPLSLPDLMRLDDEPERLPPTHLSALDDALIDAAGRFGDLLGGGRTVETLADQQDLRELHRVLDRLCHEYAVAVGPAVDLRGGQIVGTAQLIAIRARMALGMSGPTPFAGELADPSTGVVAGRGVLLAAGEPWQGARWVLQSQDGPHYPLTLSMLLFDSSGTNKDAALDEHREGLGAVSLAARLPDADAFVVAGAIEWLLYDWLMAHRDSPSSGAVEIRGARPDDARMIVTAAEAMACVRAVLDPGLFDVPTRRG